MPESYTPPGTEWAQDPRLALNHLVQLLEGMAASIEVIKHAMVGEDDETPGMRDDLTLLSEQVDALDEALRGMNGKVRVSAAEVVRAYWPATARRPAKRLDKAVNMGYFYSSPV